MNREVAQFELPDAVWKTCPWQPRELIASGLRQWLRCAGVALRDDQVIGMPSHAVDEAWHGLILCTSIYAEFCDRAYGRFLHHHPDGGVSAAVASRSGPAMKQLDRTVAAWTLVAEAGEECVLWDLDQHVDVDERWGISRDRVDGLLAELAKHD